jgi:hypothetical protein
VSAGKKILKWTLILVTIGLSKVVGHWALLFPAAILVLGSIVHISWCRKHGIDPIRATPRRRYYELRGWQWPG